MTMALQIMTPRITLRINWDVQESRGSTVPRLFLQVETINSMLPYVPQLRVTPAQKGISLSTIYFYHKISLDKIQLIVQTKHDVVFWCDLFFFLNILGIISYHFLLPVWNAQQPRWLQFIQWCTNWQPAMGHPAGQILMHRVARESQGPRQTVPYLLNGLTLNFFGRKGNPYYINMKRHQKFKRLFYRVNPAGKLQPLMFFCFYLAIDEQFDESESTRSSIKHISANW